MVYEEMGYREWFSVGFCLKKENYLVLLGFFNGGWLEVMSSN